MSKNIIVVAKYYEPLTNARAIQTTGLIKLLTKYFNVTLITSGQIDSKDSVLDNLTIYRVVEKQFLQKSYKNSLIHKIKNRLNKEFSSSFGGKWSKNVTAKLLKLIKDDNTVVLSMSEPFDSHIAVLNAKKTRQFRWFSFFSDPLPHLILPAPYNKSAISLFSLIQKLKVIKVLSSSEGVFFTNSKAGPYIEHKLGVKIKNKSHVLRHLSPSKQDYGNSNENNDYLVHVGHLTKERVDVTFLSALVNYVCSQVSINKVLLVGKVCPEAISMINNKGWRDHFELIGEVEHGIALNLVKNAKAVLLIEANLNNSPFVPSKLAEYFTIKTPIIAIANKDSETSRLIRMVGNGVVCNYQMPLSEMTTTISRIQQVTLNEDVFNAACGIYSNEVVTDTIIKCFSPLEKSYGGACD